MFNRLQRWCAVWVLILALGGAAACVPRQEPVKEIRIGVVAPFSGQMAESIGQATREGAELAVKVINKAGGLPLGDRRQQVILVYGDNQDKPDVSVSVAQKLINQENVVALVGPQLSRNAIPVARLAEEAHIPMITPTSTHPETTAGKKYIFRVVFVDDFQGQVMASFALQDLRARKAAVLYDIASVYNRGLAEIFKQVFEAQGGQIVAFESYTTGQQDFTEQITRIRAARPDVIFLPNYHNEVPLQVEQIHRAGIQATIIGSESWNELTPADRLVMEDTYFSNHYAVDAETDQNRSFVKAYQQAYGRLPTTTAAATYDAFGLLFEAVQKQGQTDPEAIRAGLAGITRYNGVTGTIEFTNGTGDPVKSAIIVQVKHGDFIFYKIVSPLPSEG